MTECSSPERCATCLESIINGKLSKALGKAFHEDCFKCSICKIKIDGGFFEEDGMPVCKDDYQARHCPDCYQCGKKIVDRSLSLEGNSYHPQCIVCSVCGKALDGQIFRKDGKLVCEDDAKSQRTTMKCDGCEEAISGTYFEVKGKNICQKCHDKNKLLCTDCSEEITGEYNVKDEKPYCKKCYENYRLKCSECGEYIVGKYFSKDDKPICEKDYEKYRLTCSVCNEYISGTYFIMDDKPVCEKDYKK